jgi:DNA-binding transcriptional ArsR family regulator
MQRKVDLIRSILLELEKAPFDPHGIEMNIPDYTQQEIGYHLMLLAEAELIDAEPVSTSDGINWKAIRPTWEGHEFLEACRDASRWEKAKKILHEKTGSIQFDLLNQLLVRLMKEGVLQ